MFVSIVLYRIVASFVPCACNVDNKDDDDADDDDADDN